MVESKVGLVNPSVAKVFQEVKVLTQDVAFWVQSDPIP